MAVKINVDGMSLREYLVKSLVKNSVRDLAKDDDFKDKTGIKTSSSINYYMRKFDITQEEIFNYGLENNMISYTQSFEEWDRTATKNTKKYKGNDDLLAECFYRTIGIKPESTTDELSIRQTILDFISEEEFEKLQEEIKAEWGWK